MGLYAFFVDGYLPLQSTAQLRRINKHLAGNLDRDSVMKFMRMGISLPNATTLIANAIDEKEDLERLRFRVLQESQSRQEFTR